MQKNKVSNVINLCERRAQRLANLSPESLAENLNEMCGTDFKIRDCLDEIRNTKCETYLPEGEEWEDIDILWRELSDRDHANKK